MEAAYESRNRTAGTFSSETIDRIAGMLLPLNMFQAPIGGAGIGVGSTGAAAYSDSEGKNRYGDASGRRLTMGEGDWDRNFSELGLVVGSIFVGLRMVFAFWLLLGSVRVARSGDMMSLLLASFAAFAMFQGQITLHTTYGHLIWFAVGLTMAAARAPEVAQAVRPATMRPRRVSWPPPVKPPITGTPQWGAHGPPSKLHH
jgi:hypothetical protein